MSRPKTYTTMGRKEKRSSRKKNSHRMKSISDKLVLSDKAKPSFINKLISPLFYRNKT